MTLVYGRLTPYELEKQGKDPYLRMGGRTFRITELVPRMEGGANYQAVECEEVEAVAWQPPEPERDEEPEVAAPAAIEVPPVPPLLRDWAKEHGWRGRGPISLYIRKKYEEEFGDAVYGLRGQ